LASHRQIAAAADGHEIFERGGAAAAFWDVMAGLEIVGGYLILAPSGVAFHFKGFATILQPEGLAEGLGDLSLLILGR
jgi:hypothetical protein